MQLSSVCHLTWYEDMLTSRRSSEGRGMRQAGGGGEVWRKTCVWEPSVIHTLLISIPLCSIQSLRHFTERGLCLQSSECLWVRVFSLKKKDFTFYLSRFNLLTYFSKSNHPALRKTSKRERLSRWIQHDKIKPPTFSFQSGTCLCFTAVAFAESSSLLTFRRLWH